MGRWQKCTVLGRATGTGMAAEGSLKRQPARAASVVLTRITIKDTRTLGSASGNCLPSGRCISGAPSGAAGRRVTKRKVTSLDDLSLITLFLATRCGRVGWHFGGGTGGRDFISGGVLSSLTGLGLFGWGPRTKSPGLLSFVPSGL